MNLQPNELYHIFSLYSNSEIYLEKSGRITNLSGLMTSQFPEDLQFSIYDGSIWKDYQYFPFKLLLYPLDKLSDEQKIEMAKVYQSNVRGGLENPIEQVRMEELLRAGKELVKNRLSGGFSHMVDCAGLLKLYQHCFRNSIALPIYPYNKTPIELGCAIDKTTLYE